MSPELAAYLQAKKTLFNWDSKRWDHSLKGTIFYPPKAWNIRLSRTFECFKPKNSTIYFKSRHWKNPKHFNIRTWRTRWREKSKQEPLMKNTKFWRRSTGEVSVLLWQIITTSMIKLCLRVKTKQKLFSNSSTKKRQWVRQTPYCVLYFAL